MIYIEISVLQRASRKRWICDKISWVKKEKERLKEMEGGRGVDETVAGFPQHCVSSHEVHHGRGGHDNALQLPKEENCTIR